MMLRERGVRVDRFLAAAEDAGVAGLQTQRRDVDRDVGAALVNHSDDAERARAGVRPAGRSAACASRSSRRQGRAEAPSGGRRWRFLRVGRGSGKAVDDRVGETGRAARLDILAIRFEDVRLVLRGCPSAMASSASFLASVETRAVRASLAWRRLPLAPDFANFVVMVIL